MTPSPIDGQLQHSQVSQGVCMMQTTFQRHTYLSRSLSCDTCTPKLFGENSYLFESHPTRSSEAVFDTLCEAPWESNPGEGQAGPSAPSLPNWWWEALIFDHSRGAQLCSSSGAIMERAARGACWRRETRSRVAPSLRPKGRPFIVASNLRLT